MFYNGMVMTAFFYFIVPAAYRAVWVRLGLWSLGALYLWSFRPSGDTIGGQDLISIGVAGMHLHF